MPTSGEETALLYFHYYPNFTLAGIALGVYVLFAILLFARVYMSHSRRFIYILGFTAAMEAIGYVFRLISAKNATLGSYIGMNLFLLLPPNALALVNYKATGEIIRLSGVRPRHFYLKPKFVTWFFFSSDVLSFLMQGSGGGLQAQGGDMAKLGQQITLIGLAAQLFFFAAFAVITVHVHRNPQYQYSVRGQTNPKARLVVCLYITTALIYIRSIYRIAEYAGGFEGPIATTEWAFYVFDSLTIALAFVVYLVLFIGNYLPRRGEEEQYSRVAKFQAQASADRTGKGNPEYIGLY